MLFYWSFSPAPFGAWGGLPQDIVRLAFTRGGYYIVDFAAERLFPLT
jgi:hypothetical protein